MKKVLFVINPGSGNRGNSNIEALITDLCEYNGFEYLIHTMDGTDQLTAIGKKITDFDPNIIAAAGGDGTVNLVAGLVAGSGRIMLIIPYGSANGMAKELNISPRIDLAIKLLENGMEKAIDLIRINDRICIHLADVGLNARIVKRFEDDVKRGIKTYAKHLFGEVFLLKQYRFYIYYDDHFVKLKAVSLTFANASRYGTGAVINPHGILDDGKLELIVVKPFPQIKLLSIAWKMFTNKLQTSEYVEVIRCHKAKIVSSRKTTLQIDGEVIGKVKEINVEVMHKALNVIVPKEAGV